MKILLIVNVPSFFLSHRLAVAQAAKEKGFDVHIASANGSDVEKIQRLGFTHHTIPFTRSGKNPFVELKALFGLARLFIRLKPDLVHLVTIKPVLYGGFLSRLLNIRAVVAAISGLGSVFTDDGAGKFLRFLVLRMYQASLRGENIRVIFQNPDDEKKLLSAGVVLKKNSRLIKGSGVDLAVYPAINELSNDRIKVVMASRLLREKGTHVFVGAAKILLSRSISAEFILVGEPDPGNPSSISIQEFEDWRGGEIVNMMGFRKDIAQIFSQSHIIVLPSYYGEGLPKVLIEAAACGRPVVTTDHPGCRDAIVAGVTGLLVPVKDAVALADAIELLVKDAERRQAMGKAARIFAEQNFSIEHVVYQHLSIYKELLQVEAAI